MKLIKIDDDTYVNPKAIASLYITEHYDRRDECEIGHEIKAITVNNDFFTLEVLTYNDRSLTKYDTKSAARQRLAELVAKLEAEEI